MEELKNQLLGQRIKKVSYFELNYQAQPFFYPEFDNFDLAIAIELGNGFHWYIGWKDNDRPEVGIGKYTPERYYESFIEVDATERWAATNECKIIDFEIEMVNSEWRIPARCTFHFDNLNSVSIFLAEELNIDGSLPLPLMYADVSQFYVFFGSELPPSVKVKIILPLQSEYFDPVEPTPTPKYNLSFYVGLIIVLLVLIIAVLKMVLDVY